MSSRRKKIMGLPIGPKRRSRLPGMVAKGAAVAALPAIAGIASRVRGDAHDGLHPLERSEEVIDHGRDVVHQGREVAGKARAVAGTVSNIKDATERHSSTIGKVGAAVKAAVKGNTGPEAPKLSHLIEQHADIAAPRRTVYDQWTQFEMFPRLTKGAESVHQDDDRSVEWASKIGPSRRQWRAKITEQKPDERIAWESEGGLSMKGVVTFHRLGDELTRVLVEMEYHPSGPVEHVGNLLRVQRRRVKRDLRLFKHFVELRHEATGSWRGTIDPSDSNGNGNGHNGGDGDQDNGKGGSAGTGAMGAGQPGRRAQRTPAGVGN